MWLTSSSIPISTNMLGGQTNKQKYWLRLEADQDHIASWSSAKTHHRVWARLGSAFLSLRLAQQTPTVQRSRQAPQSPQPTPKHWDQLIIQASKDGKCSCQLGAFSLSTQAFPSSRRAHHGPFVLTFCPAPSPCLTPLKEARIYNCLPTYL